MNSLPSDQDARDRFTSEWDVNFAVLANAGSGKTTAISQRLAAMALSPAAGRALERTAVVTYTRKAAAQISEKARQVLRARMRESSKGELDPLLRLEKVFFGTIHSFCLLLARQHGNTLGVHLNPILIDEDDDAPWHEFMDGDPMSFASLTSAQVAAFLRHERLEIIFPLARSLDVASAGRLLRKPPPARPPAPGALQAILGAPAPRQKKPAEALVRNKAAAADWARRFAEEDGPLPLPNPEGEASHIGELYRDFLAPVKAWLAEAGGVLAAELSQRYRAWRAERGMQTYSDQLEAALAVLSDGPMLEAIRSDGWRVILDEAQDTDLKQFQVLVEITRPEGSQRGSWPGEGPGPRPGHLCMVGDSQQSIYSGRADIRNFVAHAEALGSEGRQLEFSVTFRAPGRLVRFLNGTLPAAFGPGRDFNVAPRPEGPPQMLQVAYAPLTASPSNPEGAVWRVAVEALERAGRQGVDAMLAHEARQVARVIAAEGPGAVGAASLGDICILAPRKKWLHVIRSEFDKLGVKTALQIRQDRSGDNPAYSWVCGLLAVVCDPENQFEWVGVLRELFAVSDAMIAEELAGSPLRWDEPESYPPEIAEALRSVGPFILRCDDEGAALGQFAADLVCACGLRDRATLADPDGGLCEELERILAAACEIGADGAGPRQWLTALLQGSDERRGSGRPAEDAINILTCHSAKGLEWPVVIPVGLWREPGEWEPRGLRLSREGDPDAPVILDNDALSADAKLRIENERRRDLVRLLYVTLTRAKRALVVPWTAFEAKEGSLAGVWGLDAETIELLPREAAGPGSAPARPPAPAPAFPAPAAAAPPLPARVLPHALAAHTDFARLALHEGGADADLPSAQRADPLEYGTWWHHLLEFVPWAADDDAAAAHARGALARAAALGFGARAQAEWDILRGSEAWACIREPRWTRLAEAGVLGPLGQDAWIDGVMDLVLLDPAAGEVRIIDWKTNTRRSGEGDDALLSRLGEEYAPQLRAYGKSASEFFPGRRISLWLYSSAAGRWTRVGAGED